MSCGYRYLDGREEVAGSWGKLCNEDLHHFHFSPDIVMVFKWEVCMKRRYPRVRWEYTIEIYLQEIQYEDMDWIHLAEDWEQELALLDTVMNIRNACNAANFLHKKGAVGSYVFLLSNRLMLGKTNNRICKYYIDDLQQWLDHPLFLLFLPAPVVTFILRVFIKNDIYLYCSIAIMLHICRGLNVQNVR